MNIAITGGVSLMPPAFLYGLDRWSSGDGTPGSDNYQNKGNAAFVPADQDFGGCLELTKTDALQKLRYFGETPLLPGTYLQITARVKAISGPLPTLRIGAWAGGAGGVHVANLREYGPSTKLESYGDIVEIKAIVGGGNRIGVDMVWGNDALYGHFGIDISGPNGGVIRVDDIRIEDVTEIFHRDMMNWVDIRDFGAIGDGTTDDSAAFIAADAAANGRRILVSSGTYFLGSDVNLVSRVQFEGQVKMPADKVLILTKDFNLPAYIDAFGDEELAFKKAFQALYNGADHESLDLGGRTITVTEPIDMQAAVATTSVYGERRLIRNGQFYAVNGPAWNPETAQSSGSYDPADPLKMTNVDNIAAIRPGSLVTGKGVGREVYVKSVNVAARELRISNPLYDAEGTQNFTFTRFKYILDFSGFKLIRFLTLSEVELLCNRVASGVLLPETGRVIHFTDCFFTKPRDRGITSHGTGCQGLLIDRCHFDTSENSELVNQRDSIAINCNANDVKLRNNWASQFKHFALLSGLNNIITGNHFYQGDSKRDGKRSAGVILARTNCSTTFTNNYVDNCFLEWSNEHDANPTFAGGFGFSALTLSNNIFHCRDVIDDFSFIVVKPYGGGHFISNLNVTGNIFRSEKGRILRPEKIDKSYADLNQSRMSNITFTGNVFNNVSTRVENPLLIAHKQNGASSEWLINASALPFSGRARNVESFAINGSLKDASNTKVFAVPYFQTESGASQNEVQVNWPNAVKGTIQMRVSMDG